MAERDIDVDDLPRDVGQCHAMIMELFGKLDVNERKLRHVQHVLEKMLRWRYGQRSERVGDENQMFLFSVGIVNRCEEAGSEESGELSSGEAGDGGKGKGKRKGKGHGRRRLPKSLERRRRVHDVADEERFCPECRGELRLIGEEVSERLEYVPASLHVLEDVCRKYACKSGCTVVTAEKPKQVIDKGMAGPGLLAHVAVSKYGDHLPLHRQEWIFARHGVELSRKTMCDWMARCAGVLGSLFEEMKERVLSSKVMQTDDTPVAVLDRSLTRTRTGRIWTYVGDGDRPYTVYDYTPTWSRDGPDEFMKDFSGFLQADAYPGYDKLYTDSGRDITEVACWAHTRRRFYDAQSSDLMRSTVMLAYIRILYDVEREARDMKLDANERLALRREKSVPVLADIKVYLDRERGAVLPKSPEGKAISYALSNWEALVRYCEDGDLEIDNNGAERSLRGIAVGRSNWLFFGSDNGGRTAAILTSFITTCKRHKIDPFAYLRDIFERIPTHPEDRLEELLPDKWQAAQETAAQ